MAKSNEFLDYKHVETHFIYAFMWRPYRQTTNGGEIEPADFRECAFRLTFEEIRTLTHAGEDAKFGKWESSPLHERKIGSIDSDTTEKRWVGTYQPTFVTKRRSIGLVQESTVNAHVVVPLKNGATLPTGAERLPDTFHRTEDVITFPVQIQWTLRLFETFTGTTTVRVSVPNTLLSQVDRERRYESIHWLLHLVSNMDDEGDPTHDIDSRPVTDSFLHMPEVGSIRLFDYMRTVRNREIESIPQCLFSPSLDESAKTTAVRSDRYFLKIESNTFAYTNKNVAPQPTSYEKYEGFEWHENQSPFAVTNIVVNDASWQRIVQPKHVPVWPFGIVRPISDTSLRAAKEIAAIYTRLTLENTKIGQCYSNISRDYMKDVLKYDEYGRGLPNPCLDDRVFLAFSKRGALTLTHDPAATPAVFVIPSFLNLFEILRARMISGIVVTSALSDLASKMGRFRPSQDSTDTKDTFYKYLVELRSLRHWILLQTQNPIHFLFDGGSITEIAMLAEKDLFVGEIIASARRGIDATEALFSVWNVQSRNRER